MIVGFFVTTPAVYQHIRAGAIDTKTIRKLIPLAGVAVLIGVAISEAGVFAGDGEAYLRIIFAVFLVYSAAVEGAKLLHKRITKRDLEADRPKREATWSAAAAIALPTGIIAGLLGVGGGIVAVPLQRRLLGINLRHAIANSAALIIATALIGACAKNYAYITDGENGIEPVKIAASVAPTAIIGSLIGSRLTHAVPTKALKGLFLLLLLIAAARIGFFALRSLG